MRLEPGAGTRSRVLMRILWWSYPLLTQTNGYSLKKAIWRGKHRKIAPPPRVNYLAQSVNDRGGSGGKNVRALRRSSHCVRVSCRIRLSSHDRCRTAQEGRNRDALPLPRPQPLTRWCYYTRPDFLTWRLANNSDSAPAWCGIVRGTPDRGPRYARAGLLSSRDAGDCLHCGAGR